MRPSRPGRQAVGRELNATRIPRQAPHASCTNGIARASTLGGAGAGLGTRSWKIPPVSPSWDFGGGEGVPPAHVTWCVTGRASNHWSGHPPARDGPTRDGSSRGRRQVSTCI